MTRRISSSVLSLTKLGVESGHAEHLIVRTGFFIHPAAMVAGIPEIGGTKDVNLVELQRLVPSHVLVKVDKNRDETVDSMRTLPTPPQIIVTHPLDPADDLTFIDDLLTHFGALPGMADRAIMLTAALQRELALNRRSAAQGVLPDPARSLLSSEPDRFEATHLAEARRLGPKANARLIDGELLSWYGARAVPALRCLRRFAAGQSEQ